MAVDKLDRNRYVEISCPLVHIDAIIQTVSHRTNKPEEEENDFKYD